MSFPKGGSLRTRLALAFALAIAPPAIVLLGQTYTGYLQELEAFEENLIAAAKVATIEHTNLIAGAIKTLTTLASQASLRQPGGPACPIELLTDMVQSNSEFAAYAVVDRTGNVVCSSGDTKELDISDRPWLQQVLGGGEKFALSELVPSPLFRGRAFMAAVPILGASGSVMGALVTALNPLALIGATPFADLSPDTFVILVDSEGQMLDVALVPSRNLPDISSAELLQMARSEPGSMIHAKSNVGEDLVMTVEPLLDEQLNVVFGLPATNVFTLSRLKLFLSLASPLLVWVIAILTAWIAADRMVIRWVHYIQRMADLYSAGRHAIRPRNLSLAPTELRHLAASFGHMIETIEQREEELQKALEYREMLIKEIHHRVKNNLQTVTSLLNLHLRSLSDSKEREAIINVQSRINTLALVHRSLHETHDLEHVELGNFLTTLGSQLRELLNADGRDILIEIDVPHFVLPADTAVSLAMLVTEAVTNSYKYAFDGRSSGRIYVKLERDRTGAILTVADDGVGRKVGTRGRRSSTARRRDGTRLGRSLMDSFARKVGGEISYREANGTTVQVTIPGLGVPSCEPEKSLASHLTQGEPAGV